MPQSAVSLREKRSVTDVLNATFLFIRQNVRMYGKMLLLLIAPVLGLGLILSTVIATSVDFSGGSNLSPAAGISLAFGGFFFFLVLFTVSLAIYTGALTIVRLYDEHGPGNFDLEDVWSFGKSKLLGFFGIGFLLGLILVIPLLLVIWIPCLNVIAIVAWFLYVFGTFGLAYAVYIMEDASVGESLSRSRELVKNYFWPTVGLYLLTTIIVTTIGSIAQLPFQVLAFSEGMFSESPDVTSQSAVFLALSYVVAILVSTSLGMIPQVAMTFQYTNLVERKENVGLQRRVEQIAVDTEGAAVDESPRFDRPNVGPESIEPSRTNLEDPASQTSAEWDVDGGAGDASTTSGRSNTSSSAPSPSRTSGSSDLSSGGHDPSNSTPASRDDPRADSGSNADNEDARWAPPQQSDRETRDGEEDSSTESEPESEDPDDRWRPPTS